MPYALLIVIILMWIYTIFWVWRCRPSMGGWLATFTFTFFFGVLAYASILCM